MKSIPLWLIQNSLTAQIWVATHRLINSALKAETRQTQDYISLKILRTDTKGTKMVLQTQNFYFTACSCKHVDINTYMKVVLRLIKH